MQLGWVEGRNIELEYRLAEGDQTKIPAFAAELVRSGPDAILAGSTAAVAALLNETRTIPIIFATVADPVASGFVSSLSRPGGNATGFLTFEASLSGKWVQLLKELAPSTTRAAAVYDPKTTAGAGSYFFGSFQSSAKALNIESFTAFSEVKSPPNFQCRRPQSMNW